MTVYAITDTKKGRTGIAPTYLQTTRGLSMSQLTTVFLLAKSSHFLVRIIPAVRTRGSHFQFAFYRFAISQFANYQTRITIEVGSGL